MVMIRFSLVFVLISVGILAILLIYSATKILEISTEENKLEYITEQMTLGSGSEQSTLEPNMDESTETARSVHIIQQTALEPTTNAPSNSTPDSSRHQTTSNLSTVENTSDPNSVTRTELLTANPNTAQITLEPRAETFTLELKVNTGDSNAKQTLSEQTKQKIKMDRSTKASTNAKPRIKQSTLEHTADSSTNSTRTHTKSKPTTLERASGTSTVELSIADPSTLETTLEPRTETFTSELEMNERLLSTSLNIQMPTSNFVFTTLLRPYEANHHPAVSAIIYLDTKYPKQEVERKTMIKNLQQSLTKLYKNQIKDFYNVTVSNISEGSVIVLHEVYMNAMSLDAEHLAKVRDILFNLFTNNKTIQIGSERLLLYKMPEMVYPSAMEPVPVNCRCDSGYPEYVANNCFCRIDTENDNYSDYINLPLIIGLAVGIPVPIIIVCVIFGIWFRKRRKQRNPQETEDLTNVGEAFGVTSFRLSGKSYESNLNLLGQRFLPSEPESIGCESRGYWKQAGILDNSTSFRQWQ